MKDSFAEDIFEHIKERIADYANGNVWYACDLVSELTMYENCSGAWIIGTYQASEYIKNNWSVASDTFEYFRDNMGMSLNPFESPERFTFYMLAYGVETLCSYSDILNDYTSDQIELTEETAQQIINELDEVSDLSMNNW